MKRYRGPTQGTVMEKDSTDRTTYSTTSAAVYAGRGAVDAATSSSCTMISSTSGSGKNTSAERKRLACTRKYGRRPRSVSERKKASINVEARCISSSGRRIAGGAPSRTRISMRDCSITSHTSDATDAVTANTDMNAAKRLRAATSAAMRKKIAAAETPASSATTTAHAARGVASPPTATNADAPDCRSRSATAALESARKRQNAVPV